MHAIKGLIVASCLAATLAGCDPAKGGDERQKFSAKPKVEKKIDPDNPFAAALAGFNKG